MTSSFGIIVILGLLVMIPFSFIGAGCDAERTHASRVQRQREAAMEWTDKDILAAEHTELRREFYGEPCAEKGCPRCKGSGSEAAEGMPSPQFAA